MIDDGPWLRRYVPVARPRVRLVCLPHAGGSAPFYRPWARGLPSPVELVSVQYPGRADRRADPFPPDLVSLAVTIADALERDLAGDTGVPVALFGHSLGAAVAFELARERERRGWPAVHVFVSGRPEPTVPGSVHLAGDDAIWADTCRLEGTPSELADDPVVRELSLPALRADFRLSETYVCSPDTAAVGAPLTVYTGDRDPECDPCHARVWGGRTREPGVSVRVFEGDHFYLVPARGELLADLSHRLAGSVPGGLWPAGP